jgi:transposase InsO family protein
MEERAKFVLEALEGWTSMSELCSQYGISRRIGYKWLKRYQAGGLSALADRRRARETQGLATPPDIVNRILALRRKHPSWGPRKLRERLCILQPGVPWPAPSTIGAILRREGLTKPRRRRPRRAGAWSLKRTAADQPNRVWTVDFKGEFRLGCGRWCYPLTIVDAHSRFLLSCYGLPSTATSGVRAVFERVFRTFGLPEIVRTDNGVPFRTQAIGGLSQLAVWWLRLGIGLEHTRPRHPEDNGAHERMHRVLKSDVVVRESAAQQQRAFEQFRNVYNNERPHQALGMATPRAHYAASARAIPTRLPQIQYPEHFETRRILGHGEFSWQGGRYFLSEVLTRQTIGLERAGSHLWTLYFGPARLAILDAQEGALRPLERGLKDRKRMKKVLPMCPV